MAYAPFVNQITSDPFVARRDRFLQALQTGASAHPHLVALWLEGSFGRGRADRYSDLDIHVLIPEADLPAFKVQVEEWLSETEPLVLFNLLFGGRMVNALTEGGLRLDLWPHAGETITLDPARVLVLHERPGSITRTSSPPADSAARGQTALAHLREFWRCISLVPAVIGRNERLVAVIGLNVELNLVAELLLLGSGVVRDRGVKNLNGSLPADARAHLERLVTLRDLSAQTLVDAHLGLARMVQREGPHIAERFSFDYPKALEVAVLTYVQGELALLGLNDQALRRAAQE